MTPSHPSYRRSGSHNGRNHGSHEDKERLSRYRLPAQDQDPPPRRPKSRSKARQPYTFNCGRRRWPPSPKVEEVACEDRIPMRGIIGQDPMIIDVPYSTSNDSGSTHSRESNYSSEPETPPVSDSDNYDKRYVWKPEPDIPIPQTYGTADNVERLRQKSTVSFSERDRGRKAMHRLDTNIVQTKAVGGSSPVLERARSPYASGPQDRKSKSGRSSGEYLLSPDMINPRRTDAESPRSQSQYFPRPAEPKTKTRPAQEPVRLSMENQRSQSHYTPRPVEIHNIGRGSQGKENPKAYARPSMERCASELPYPSDSPPATRRATQEWNTHNRSDHPSIDGRTSEKRNPVTPPSAGAVRPLSRRPTRSHHNSDSDHGEAGRNHGGASPKNPPRHQAMDFQDQNGRKSSSELPVSPSVRCVRSFDTDGPPVNLSSLVSGAAIKQTLAAMFKGDLTAGRKASPRPSPRPSPGVSPLASPRGSPKTTPYSSPPGTPPSESYHSQAAPHTSFKKHSPISSRPPSPLSSRSSTWTMGSNQNPAESDQHRRSRPAPLQPTSKGPLPPPRFEELRVSEPSTPGVFVRSPSQPGHTTSCLLSGEPQHSRTGPRPTLPTESSKPNTLRPMGFSGRPRSVSSADVRPQLTVNPVAFLQGHDSSSSPRSRSRARSPSVVTPGSPGDRYKPPHSEPTVSAVHTSSPHPETGSFTTRSRSRSYVPAYISGTSQATPIAHAATPTAHAATPTTHAATLNTTAPGPRSRSINPTPGSVDMRSRSSAPKPITPASPPMQPVNFPACPRPRSITGYSDWFALKQNTAFTICPSCRDNVFGSTYEHHLQPRHVSSSRKTLCDLNNPWVRLACLLRGPDVNLLSALSEVTSKERACPGDELAPRDWYRLEDPETGKHIPGVNACSHCVHSLEILFPHWRNVFYPTHTSHHHERKERFCSLRCSGIRFGDYLDMIVESSREAESRRKPPNTKPVCDLAKQLAAIDDCPRDKMKPRKAWHVHPHLPEFTICQDCYETVVYPLVKTGSPLAAKIDKKPQQFPNPDVKCCCNLYSPRMRKVFREACEDDDYEHLRHTVLKRHMLQQDLLETLGEKDQHPRDSEITDRLQELVAKWKDRE